MDVIKTSGADELVVLTRAEYDALTARAAEAERSEADEEDWLLSLYDDAKSALARGEDSALPASLWAAVRDGESRLRLIREHRGLSTRDLAARAGVTEALLSDLEAGRGAANAGALAKMAAALEVPTSLLSVVSEPA